MCMSNKESRVHPETLKMYHSPNYRKKIKRLTESFKALRGMTGTKLAGNLRQLKATATQEEKEAHSKIWSYTLDRSTARYFTQYAAFSSDRRASKGTPTESN